MPTVEQQMAAVLVNQALGTIMQYVQAINLAKQDGLSDIEKVSLSMAGLTMAMSLSSQFMLAPKGVLAAMPSIAPYVRVELPETLA